jgi:hypothetical protein
MPRERERESVSEEERKAAAKRARERKEEEDCLLQEQQKSDDAKIAQWKEKRKRLLEELDASLKAIDDALEENEENRNR